MTGTSRRLRPRLESYHGVCSLVIRFRLADAVLPSIERHNGYAQLVRRRPAVQPDEPVCHKTTTPMTPTTTTP